MENEVKVETTQEEDLREARERIEAVHLVFNDRFINGLNIIAAKVYRVARKDSYNNGQQIDWITFASSITVENILAVVVQDLSSRGLLKVKGKEVKAVDLGNSEPSAVIHDEMTPESKKEQEEQERVKTEETASTQKTTNTDQTPGAGEPSADNKLTK